jgi:hypothetical protein
MTYLIVLLAALSYASGIRAVFTGRYRPSIYSRLIWLLLSLNSFAGVVLLHNRSGIVALAAIQAAGCIIMFAGALKYSVRTFGITEKICSLLLLASGAVWLTARSPLVNVLIGLACHFIGAVPSLLAAHKKPSSENFLFWLFFALASMLAFIAADKSQLQNFIYALYFAIFDLTMTLLSARQFIPPSE